MELNTKSHIGMVFFLSMIGVVLVGANLLITHMMFSSEKIGAVMSPEIYRWLILKWFLAGIVFGMMTMFFLVESWIWKNWKSWNKFCCDHHEKIYRSQMGISQGRMLRR